MIDINMALNAPAAAYSLLEENIFSLSEAELEAAEELHVNMPGITIGELLELVRVSSK